MTRTLIPRTVLHGPLLMLVANLLFAMVPVSVRVAGTYGVSSSQVTFIRFAVGWIFCLVLWAAGAGSLRAKNRTAVALRGILGGAAVLCYFHAVTELGAGKGVILNYTHSLWANLFAVLLLRERPPRGFWLLLALAAVGLWFVIDPHFGAFGTGEALGLLSGALGGGAILAIKFARRTDGALVILASFSLWGMLFALVVPAAGAVTGGSGPGWFIPVGGAAGAVLAVGLFGVFSQYLFTHAYGFTSVALGTVMSLSVPALAALVGWVWLGETLTPHFVLGAALILTAMGAMGVQEGRGSARRTGAASGTASGHAAVQPDLPVVPRNHSEP